MFFSPFHWLLLAVGALGIWKIASDRDSATSRAAQADDLAEQVAAAKDATEVAEGRHGALSDEHQKALKKLQKAKDALAALRAGEAARKAAEAAETSEEGDGGDDTSKGNGGAGGEGEKTGTEAEEEDGDGNGGGEKVEK